MNAKYCLPIIKTTKAAVRAKLAAVKGYDYFEIWVDYIEDVDHPFISELITEFGNRLIFVFRRLNLETPVMELQPRLSIISLLNGLGAYADLDVITQQEELSYIQNNMLKIPIITSYHNYRETPDDKKFIEIIAIMMKYKPEIIKFAAKCNNPKDALRLLDLLISLKSEQKKYIILGMGEFGSITRIYGTLWGNEIVFVPERKEEASAPGQLTRQELETILNILSTKN